MNDGAIVDNIKFFLDDKINTLRLDIKDDIHEISSVLSEHRNYCNNQMMLQNNRLMKVEKFENKISGAAYTIAVISASIASVMTTFLINILK